MDVRPGFIPNQLTVSTKPTIKDNLIIAFTLTMLPVLITMSFFDPYNKTQDQRHVLPLLLGATAVSWTLGYKYIKRRNITG